MLGGTCKSGHILQAEKAECEAVRSQTGHRCSGAEEVLSGLGTGDAGRSEEEAAAAGREEPDHEGLQKSRSNEGFEWTSDVVTGGKARWEAEQLLR